MYVRLKNGFLTAVYDFVKVICSFFDDAEMDLSKKVFSTNSQKVLRSSKVHRFRCLLEFIDSVSSKVHRFAEFIKVF